MNGFCKPTASGFAALRGIILGTIVAVLVAAGSYWLGSRNFEPVSIILPDNQESTASETYQSEIADFSFSYPSDLVLSNGSIYLPFDSRRISGVEIVRPLRRLHCSESGLPEHCLPLTYNPAVTFAVVGMSYEAMVEALEKSDIGDLLEDTVIAGIPAKKYTIGVEGEGIYMYFLPLRKSRLSEEATLVIGRSYIDQNTLIGYKKVPGFLSLEQQEALFNEIVGTLKIE